jgi:hypothetical protein
MPVAMAQFDNVFLTYASDINPDGAGAQLHRMYGIYSLSRMLGTRYLHSPLHDVYYQGLGSFQSQEKDPAYVERFNRTFAFPSDEPRTGAPTLITLPSVPVGGVERALGVRFGGRRTQLSPIRFSKFGRLIATLSAANQETVVRIGNPHALMDRYAHGYAVCKSLSPFRNSAPNQVLRIALHVRRGELMFVNSERLIDTVYYVEIARKLVAALARERVPYQLELHSEVLQKSVTVQPDDPAFKGRVADPIELRPEQDPFGDFAVFPDLQRFINEPTMTCIERLATADILITSKSSFSYLAGILNVRGKVLYHPFWHYPLPDWIVTDPKGNFDIGRVLGQLRRLQSAAP